LLWTRSTNAFAAPEFGPKAIDEQQPPIGNTVVCIAARES
jgi:hypothetical protein